MNNLSAGNIELDFSSREGARKREFSPIWRNTLNAVFADIAPYYDLASNVASLGLCDRWRQRLISSVEVKPGDAVLDVCAGTNAVGIGLLQRQPDIHVFALDRSEAMQEVGRELARSLGFQIESVINDAHELPFSDNSFDIVTLQWASRHLQVVDVFSEIRRVLKPGGCFYHCDMLRPEHKLVEMMYSAYLKACVSVTALAFRSGRDAWMCRDYFVRAVQMFYSSEELTELLATSGFSAVSSQSAAGGIVACHKAVKG
jgi:demethylmenaquinone methyltransferase/2-methoxy-6-polyprenyl-1,4-benzoquinol methylase